MVAQLVKLKVTLLRNSLKRSVWQLVALIVGSVYMLGVIVLALAGIAALSVHAPQALGTVWVLVGCAFYLGWTVIPVVFTGVDMTLDPARFATFGIRASQLLPGLSVASLIGLPGVATALIVILGQFISYLHVNVAAAFLSIPSGALACVSCVVLSRLSTSAAGGLMSSRRFRDVSQLILFVPLVLLGPIIATLATVATRSPHFLPELAGVLQWTPLGAAWAIPAALVRGDWLLLVISVVSALVLVSVCFYGWNILLRRALHNPPTTTTKRQRAGKLGWFAHLPATPTGGVAARSLTYWTRDPRYFIVLILVPVFAVMFSFWSRRGGDSMSGVGMYWMLGVVVAFILGFSIAADISYDNTAFALHVFTGVSGVADRMGRVIAVAVLAIPLLILVWVIPPLIFADWHLIALSIGLSLAVLGVALGASSAVSARFIYATAAPGESPFKSPPGGGVTRALIQLGSMATTALICLPMAALVWGYFATGSWLFALVILVAGGLWGSFICWLGVRIGARWYERRAPELFSAVSMYR